MRLTALLNVAGLLVGLAAAILLAILPPQGVVRYTREGSGFVNWTTGRPTEAGCRRGRQQWWLSTVAGPGLLAVAFVLQLLAVLLPRDVGLLQVAAAAITTAAQAAQKPVDVDWWPKAATIANGGAAV